MRVRLLILGMSGVLAACAQNGEPSLGAEAVWVRSFEELGCVLPEETAADEISAGSFQAANIQPFARQSGLSKEDYRQFLSKVFLIRFTKSGLVTEETDDAGNNIVRLRSERCRDAA